MQGFFFQNDALSPRLHVATACVRVSDHIWSFYDVAWSVDVPTLWQCQNSFKGSSLICSMMFHNAGF